MAFRCRPVFFSGRWSPLLCANKDRYDGYRWTDYRYLIFVNSIRLNDGLYLFVPVCCVNTMAFRGP
jgi:hypothetical protein